MSTNPDELQLKAGDNQPVSSKNPLDSAGVDPFEVAKEAARQIAEQTGVAHHDIALMLGSGWAKAADSIGETVANFAATNIVGFSAPVLDGHVGNIRSVRLPNGQHALILGARTHFYETRNVRRVAHGVRTAAAAGVKTMILTNGAGGINPAWKPGTPVLISDHINLTGATPLEGAAFVDMSDLYSSRIRDLARSVAPELDEGVYCQFSGPQYETPAEIKMARAIGGEIVGMSTALEAIASRHAGMEVFGMSLITNLAAGIQKTPLSHAEVIETGRSSEVALSALLTKIVHAL